MAEHRALTVGLLDLDAGPVDDAVDGVLGLVAGEGPPSPEIAVRGGACYVPRLAPHRLDRRRAPIELAAEGTILITGGLGGLGLALTERLVARGARDIALMSRRPPSAEVEARVAAWAARGARVRPVAGDVASMSDVRRVIAALAERGPPLVGVVHAAGVLDDGLLVDLTAERFDRVLAPKVLGGLNLAAAVDASCFIVLFSSIAGVLGTPGQGNYAAANVALDALAASLCARGRAALSIQWGPWAEVGMAARLADRRGRGVGIEALSPGRALDAFERALAHRGAAVAVVAWGDESPAPDAPLFAELFSSSKPADEAPDREARSAPGHLRDALDGLSADARRSMMLDALVAHIGAVLELDPSQIDAGRPAVDLGMDSLLVMEVLDRFKHDLGMVVYPREFYRQPSVRAMADYLLAELARDVGRTGDEPPPASVPVAHHDADSLEAQLDPTLAPPTPIERVGFVLAAPRSGSTLLRVMLHGHPALFAPPELWLLSANDMAQRAAHFATSTLDQGYVQAVRGALDCSTAEAEARVAELVDAGAPAWAAYRALTALIGDRVLLDKTPTYGTHPPTLERIARWFAPGPLIHLVRHPLAVLESIVRTRLHRLIGDSEADPWFIAEGIWTRTEENVRAFAANHPDRAVHRLRFEDLVTRPRETIEALCDALGLGFEPAMLEPYAGDRMTGGLRPGSAPLGDQNFARHRAVDARLADAWRGVELPRALDARTRSLADEFGYALPARRDRVAVPAPPPSEAESEARPLRVDLGRLHLGGRVWGADADPVVLAVHGVLDHAGVWTPVAERLVAQGLRVVALDLRGHGASDHVGPEAGYPPLDFVHDLAAVCGAIGGAPAAVVGHSLGAATAALHAAATRGRWPLVLIEPPLPGPATPSADSLAQWLGARTATARHPVFSERGEAIERLRRSMPGVPEDALAAFADRAIRRGPDGLTWAWDPRLRERADLLAGAVDPESFLTLLAGLDPPPALVFARDGLVRRADRARMVGAVGERARVVTLDGGHHLPLTAPEAVAAAIAVACRAEVDSSGA